MTLIQQLKTAIIEAPLSLIKLRHASLKWMGIYSLSGIIIFSLFIWLMLSNQEFIKNAFLDYFFPQSWHEISETLADFLFESQTKTVVGNMILAGSLVMASIFLFPIKEKYSAEFEKDAKYQNGKVEEFSLIYQAWEESKLFLVYLTAQSLILWIGYYPYQWTTWLSIGLSYLFLFFTFGLDLISPTLQRHRTDYSVILKVFFKKPILPVMFGLIFSIPVILLSKLVFSYEELTLIEVASILFLTNIIFLTIAIPCGTLIASRLLPIILQTLPPKRKSVIWGYSIMSATLVFFLTLHTQLIVSLHHKSQLLKAEYDIDWSSMDFKLPSFSQLTNGKALSNISFDIVINNPTEFDIIIEDSQIFVEQKDATIAVIDLNGFELPTGENRRITINLDSNSDLSKVSKFTELLDDWRVDIHLQVWPGIPFVFNIVEP